MFYTYVLKSEKDDKLYTGFTHDLRERFKQHNNGKVFSTKGRGPFKLVYYEACKSEQDATMREKYLKSGMGKRYLKNRLKRSLSLTGFTLIELVVVIAVTAVLSGVILFSITVYISKGKDSNIAGNLAILIPAGEIYYNGNSNSYSSFCDPDTNSVVKNAISQMPVNTLGSCYSAVSNPSGLCCAESLSGQAWVACVKEFVNTSNAYCVDSRGMKKEISNSVCVSGLPDLSSKQCP